METRLDVVTRSGGKRCDGRADLQAWVSRSRELARRSKEAVLRAAVVGGLTGLGVAGFDTAVTRGVQAMNVLPLWAAAVGPFVGIERRRCGVIFLGAAASPSRRTTTATLAR